MMGKFLNTLLLHLIIPMVILISHQKEWIRLELFTTGSYCILMMCDLAVFLFMGEAYWKFNSTLEPEFKQNWNSVLVAAMIKLCILFYTQHYFVFALCLIIHLFIFHNCEKYENIEKPKDDETGN